MDNGVEKSCWGLTVKAVVGFGVFLLLAWLISGASGTSAMLVAG